ncbi:hypothetical protein EVAR_78056_1 [Eumeta japonica]|uniref:Uncharacterized protein n=1 Tax=Eumeta variegata TaxID=151549 RepID=A0A4C1T087_EUMVA|nr:hypothetical protein EVAR_78056_1 [Eumeta japonica]
MQSASVKINNGSFLWMSEFKPAPPSLPVHSRVAMIATKALLLLLLPLAYHRFVITVEASGDGNIRLLEDEIAAALEKCSASPKRTRQRRSGHARRPTRIDGEDPRDDRMYGHVRRSTNDTRDKIQVLNATDYDYEGYGTGRSGESFVMRPPSTVYHNNESIHNPNQSIHNQYQSIHNPNQSIYSLNQSVHNPNQSIYNPNQSIHKRIKRLDHRPFHAKSNTDKVDPRGIPRESDLWKLIQSTVTSQQSRALLRDQLKACFQELQSG